MIGEMPRALPERALLRASRCSIGKSAKKRRSSGLAPAKSPSDSLQWRIELPGARFQCFGQCLARAVSAVPTRCRPLSPSPRFLAARLSTTAEKPCLCSLPSNSLPATRSWASTKPSTPIRARPRSTWASASTTNEEGKIPLLRAVREAEKARVDAALPRGYLPIDGIAAYDAAVQKLLLGNDSPLIAAGRVRHGAGARRHGRTEDRRRFPEAREPGREVAISDPSWENHRALFESAGFEVVNYPYYDAATPRRELRGHARGARTAMPPARSSCCTRAATTRPAST